MLICSSFPSAVRVQPSQGDGGLDVFLPGPAGADVQREVYQVKRFCERLNSSQKRKIKRSLENAIMTANAEGWTVTKWHLVMPLDPTDNELRWFQELVEDCRFPCEINGLLFCDTLAARHPKVIDYYLRDGRDRLQAAMDNLTAVISGRQDRLRNAPLVAGDVAPDLAAIHRSLNEYDPFYRYDFIVSDSPPPIRPAAEMAGLVAVYAMRQESVWITIMIYALSLAALQERPISGQFNMAIPDGDDELRQQFERFIDYGAPISMPAGTVSGSLDLPGGLGGDISGASLEALSVADRDAAEPAELLLAILAPDSESIIATTTIKRTELTSGQAGVRSVFVEQAGIFTLEMLVKAGRLEGQMVLHVDYDLTGRRPAEVIDGLNVLAAWHSPNRIAFGRSYGPPDYGVVATVTTDRSQDAKRWAKICEALARIQDHARSLLRMPAEMTKDQAVRIIETAKLVSGEPVSGSMSGEFTVTHDDEPQIEREMDKTYEFIAIKAIKFTLGNEVVTVGKQTLFFRGRYLEIGDNESKIEPFGDGISVRYTGDAEVTRLFARHLQGTINADAPNDEPSIGGGLLRNPPTQPALARTPPGAAAGC
jgi:hypothetical protein